MAYVQSSLTMAEVSLSTFLQVGELTEKVGELTEKVEKIDGRLDKIDARFDKIDARLDKIDARLDKVEARFDARFDKLELVLTGIHSLLSRFLFFFALIRFSDLARFLVGSRFCPLKRATGERNFFRRKRR